MLRLDEPFARKDNRSFNTCLILYHYYIYQRISTLDPCSDDGRKLSVYLKTTEFQLNANNLIQLTSLNISVIDMSRINKSLGGHI